MPIPLFVKSTRGLSQKSVKNADWFSKLIHKIMLRKAVHIWTHIGTQIKGRRILDVGMGSGSISYFLNKKGFEVTSVDVSNLSIYDDLKPVLYDGHKLPFKNNEFDTAVIIHVLHHCDDGPEVLVEAKRVAKRVVLIEDTFRNKWEWLLVASFDSLTNGELWWHKYRKVSEWKRIIKRQGWAIKDSNEWSESGITSPYGRYAMFVIE